MNTVALWVTVFLIRLKEGEIINAKRKNSRSKKSSS